MMAALACVISMGRPLLQMDRLGSNTTELRAEEKAAEPLSLLARGIASALSVEHCAIEYTTASGRPGWAGSAKSDMIRDPNDSPALTKKKPGDEDDPEGQRKEARKINGVSRSHETKVGLLIRMPLMLKSGTLIGRIWLADPTVRILDAAETDCLSSFARVASELIYQESRITRLLDAQSMSRTGMWTWRADNGKFFGSSQFFDILGMTGRSAGVRPSLTLRSIEKGQRRVVLDAFKSAIKTRTPVSLELQLQGGDATHAMATMRIDVDLKGQLIGAFGVLQDQTDQRRAKRLGDRNRDLEDALNVANELAKQQKSFVSMVSHEFRTPLAIIDGNAHRLLKQSETTIPDRWCRAVGKIRNSVTRLTELIESLLASGRLDNGRLSFDPQPCSLPQLLAELAQNYGELYPDYDILLDLELLPHQLTADQNLLRHVFSNLFSNAVKYSPHGSCVWVSGWMDDNDSLVIAIRDQGPGIPKNEQCRLFDRFYRASTSIGIAGSGIGLHLARELVTLHNGTIDLDSEEGRGSTFRVRLPQNPTSLGNPADNLGSLHQMA
jgi:signal transduction histidine kinase